jgi:hypothetical protein
LPDILRQTLGVADAAQGLCDVAAFLVFQGGVTADNIVAAMIEHAPAEIPGPAVRLLAFLCHRGGDPAARERLLAIAGEHSDLPKAMKTGEEQVKWAAAEEAFWRAQATQIVR